MRAIALLSFCLTGGYHGRRLQTSTGKAFNELDSTAAFSPSSQGSHLRRSNEADNAGHRCSSKISAEVMRRGRIESAVAEVGSDRLIHHTTYLKKSDALLAVDKRAPCVILVRTGLDQNVGAAARAMLNFGLSDLRLVSPECDWLSDDARARASGADILLEEAKCFDSVQEAVADLHTVYATTARVRHLTQHVMTPDLASKEIASSEHQAGILFGPETSGLTNEHLEIADSLVYIPTNPHFSSLNLAQAVNILGYATWQAQVKARADNVDDEVLTHAGWADSPDLQPAKKEEVQGFVSRLEGELDATSFTHDDAHRAHTYQLVRALFNRLRLSAKDVRVLHGIVTALIGKKPPRPK